MAPMEKPDPPVGFLPNASATATVLNPIAKGLQQRRKLFIAPNSWWDQSINPIFSRPPLLPACPHFFLLLIPLVSHYTLAGPSFFLDLAKLGRWNCA
jgi:hypothetical protein